MIGVGVKIFPLSIIKERGSFLFLILKFDISYPEKHHIKIDYWQSC